MKLHVNQINLYYEEEGEGFPVILLHGYPLDHSIWDEIIPILSDKFRVIAPDLRGHGKTEAPESVYSMLMVAEDIIGLMDSLETKKAVLVGHSMGGYASLAFAHAFPERLSGLALVASHARADTPENRQARLQMAERVLEHGTREIVDSMLSKLTTHLELVPKLRRIIQEMKPTGVAGILRGMAERPDSIPFLNEIKVPALVIAGGVDSFIPLEYARETAIRFAAGKLVTIPDAGHMPMLEFPEETACAIEDLINRSRNKSDN